MPTQDFHASQHDWHAVKKEGHGLECVKRVDDDGVSTEQRTSIVSALLRQRFSCRYFTDRVPDDELLKTILHDARNAPSGSNFQPWRVHVVRGARKADVVERVTQASRSSTTTETTYRSPYEFYPSNEKITQQDEYAFLVQRRAAFGKQFFGPLQLDRSDVEARKRTSERNWRFFDAPVGLIVTTIDIAPTGSYLDVGFFVMSIVLAARARGLECCVQEAHATYHAVYADALKLPKTESVVCGVALGFADWDKVESLAGKQGRMPIDELVVFHDV